jgi:hypothetical protein
VFACSSKDHRRTHSPLAAAPGVAHFAPSVAPLAQTKPARTSSSPQRKLFRALRSCRAGWPSGSRRSRGSGESRRPNGSRRSRGSSEPRRPGGSRRSSGSRRSGRSELVPLDPALVGRAALVGVHYAQRAGGSLNAGMDNVPMGARASHAKRPYRRERQFVANDDFQHRSTSMMFVYPRRILP